MTHLQIKNEIGRIAQTEREITKKLLFILCEAEKRRSYLEFGFSSLFNWLTQEFKYSNGAADRRVKAAQLLRSVPESAEKIRDGSLNLTTTTQAKYALNAAEKAGTKITDETRAKALKIIENKSKEQAVEALLGAFPEAAPKVTKAKNRRMKNNITRCPMDFNDKQMANLKRVRELLSHTMPKATDAELMAYLMEVFLKKEDPLQKKSPAGSTAKVSKAQIRRNVIVLAEGACTFKDPKTGRVCGSRHQIEIDHIKPRALGGDDSPENLRVLCRRHNILMAERAFGEGHMSQFRRT